MAENIHTNSPDPKFTDELIAPMHTCEHIINRTMIKLFNCGRAIEAHIEKKKSKMDFILTKEPSENDIRLIEDKVNEVIRQDLPVSMEFITKEKAIGRFDLKRLPDDASNTVRIVKVGNFDECLCIGIHVKSTSQIGVFKIVNHSYDNNVLRIRFKLI